MRQQVDVLDRLRLRQTSRRDDVIARAQRSSLDGDYRSRSRIVGEEAVATSHPDALAALRADLEDLVLSRVADHVRDRPPLVAPRHRIEGRRTDTERADVPDLLIMRIQP